MTVTLKNKSSASIATPATGKTSIFVDTADGKVKRKDEFGAVVSIEDVAAGVSTFNGRSGVVIPLAGDYTPVQVGADPAGTSASGISAHEAAANPHPVYLTQPEGDGLYTPIAHVGSGGASHANATSSVAGFMSAADKASFTQLQNGYYAANVVSSDFTVETGKTWMRHSGTSFSGSVTITIQSGATLRFI